MRIFFTGVGRNETFSSADRACVLLGCAPQHSGRDVLRHPWATS
jgi:hypothetical protein